MGKETKIGLTVILVLLVGLGVVVANRLTAPAEEPLASQAKNEQHDASNKGGKAKGDTVKVLPKSPRKTTVVTSKNTTTHPPKSSSSVISRWSVTSDTSNNKRVGSTASDAVSPPSFMPNPHTVVTAAPRPRYGSRGASNSQPTRNPLYAAGRTHQYSQKRTSPTAVTTPPPSPVPAFRVSQTAQRPEGSGYGQTNPGTYSSGGYSSNDYSGGARTTYGGGSAYGQRSMPATGPVRQYSTPPSSGGLAITSSIGSQTRGENGEYEVQPNDSYWVISRKLYGSGSYFKALAEHNSRKYPRRDQLQIGDVIIAPSLSQLEQTYPELVPKPSRREIVRNRTTTVSMTSQYMGGRTYVVEEGDTLSDIARYELGKANRWVEIYELNRDRLGKDFDYLVPGISLILPNDAASDGGAISNGRDDVLTRRPGTVYRR